MSADRHHALLVLGIASATFLAGAGLLLHGCGAHAPTLPSPGGGPADRTISGC